MEMHLLKVQTIEGVGPAYAKRLAKIGITTVADLLAITTSELNRKLKGDRIATRVGRWKILAGLLDVRGMTANWAEALVNADIDSLERITASSISQFRKAFSVAIESNIIQKSPSLEEIVQLKVQATKQLYSGVYMGVVVDDKGKKLKGAELQILDLSTQTNARGIFRIASVPLGQGVKVVVRHASCDTAIIRNPLISVGQDSYRKQKIRLTRKQKLVENHVPEKVTLKELHGDKLPPLSGFPIRVKRLKHDEIEIGDVVRVRKQLANGDIDLVSRFRSFSDGVVIVDAFRVKQSDFPTNYQFGDHFIKTENGWRKTKVTAKSLQNLIRKLHFRRIVDEVRPTPDAQGLDKLIARLGGQA